MWIATRTFRYRGATYQRGNRVPAETWPTRRALIASRRIREVEDVEPAALAAMKRDELNAYAVDHGLADAETYPNKEALVEAVTDGPEAPNLHTMKRAELDDYATKLGIESAEDYPNIPSLIEAVEERLTAPPSDAEARAADGAADTSPTRER